MLLELLQLFVPLRCSSPIDVLANSAAASAPCCTRSSPSAGGVLVLWASLGALALSRSSRG
jgi:hypothetical protein